MAFIAAMNPQTALKLLEALEVYREALEKIGKAVPDSECVIFDEEENPAAQAWFTIATRRKKLAREAISRVSEILGGEK
jgi:hypothetical protein